MFITGVIVDPDGVRVPDAVVFARPRGSLDAVRRVSTNAAGEFVRLIETAGEYEVYAVARFYPGSESAVVTVSDQHPTASATLRLVPNASIRGVLKWAKTSEPIIDVEVYVSCDSLEGSKARDSFGVFGAHPGKTDFSGAFELRDLIPGAAYTLHAAPDREHPACSASLPHVLAGARDVVFVIERSLLGPASVHGSVRLEEGGVPEPRAFVQLWSHEPGFWTDARRSRLAADGSFELEGLMPGVQYCLSVHDEPDHVPALADAWTATLESVPEFALVLQRARTIEVTLVGSTNEGVAPDDVRFEPHPSRHHPAMDHFVRHPVDREGKTMLRLWPGRYTARGRGVGNRWTEPVEVVIGEVNAPLVLTLPPR